MVHKLARASFVPSHEQYVPQLELVSVTEHNFDQKNTTSWVMDDLHRQITLVAQVSLLCKYSQVTESRQSTNGASVAVTAALTLDHPPLASGVRSPASTQPGVSVKTNGSRAPPLCLNTHALLLSLPPLTDDSSLSQEHDDQALTDPHPVAQIVAIRSAWQLFAASTHEFNPTGGFCNVLSVHLKVRSA